VPASFTVAWENARAKAPHTAEESLVKPAAVKIARIMCSDVIVQECATRTNARFTPRVAVHTWFRVKNPPLL